MRNYAGIPSNWYNYRVVGIEISQKKPVISGKRAAIF